MASVESDLGEGMYSLRWGGNRIAVSSRVKLTPGQSLILKSETSPEGKPTLVVQGPALPERGHAEGRAAYSPPASRDAASIGGIAVGAAPPPAPAGPPQPSSSLLGAVLEMLPEFGPGMERLLAAAAGETRALAEGEKAHAAERRETAIPPAPQTAELEKARQTSPPGGQATDAPPQTDPPRRPDARPTVPPSSPLPPVPPSSEAFTAKSAPPVTPELPNAPPPATARSEQAPQPKPETISPPPETSARESAGKAAPPPGQSAAEQTPAIPDAPTGSPETERTPPQAPVQASPQAPVADGGAVSQAYVKEVLTQMVKAAALPLVSRERDNLSLGVRPAKVPEAVADKAAGILLRAAGLTPDLATLEAGKALLENNVPIDRSTVQALMALAAGTEGGEREAVLNAAARLSAKDIPVAMPLASGMADVIARADSVSRLVGSATAALAEAASSDVGPMLDAAREMLDLLMIDLDAPEAPQALERFVSTFGRETLGKALALVETSAQAALESHPVLPKIDQALAVILATLETAPEPENIGAAPAPPPQAPSAPAEAPPPVSPPPSALPTLENAPPPGGGTPSDPPPPASAPEQPPPPASSPVAAMPAVSDAPTMPPPAVPIVSSEAPIPHFTSPPQAASPAVVQPAPAVPAPIQATDGASAPDEAAIPDTPSISPDGKSGRDSLLPPRHDPPLSGVEQEIRRDGAPRPMPDPETGIPRRDAMEALATAPANPPRVSGGADMLRIPSLLSPATDARNSAPPSMPSTPIPTPAQSSAPLPTPPGGAGETGAPNAGALEQAPVRESPTWFDARNQSRGDGVDLGSAKEAALSGGGKAAEHPDALGLTKTDPFFQTPGFNRPEIEILKPSGYLDRYLRGDGGVSAKAKADAATLVKDILSNDQERAEAAMRQLPTKDAAVLRETAARLSRLETEIMRGEPLLNRLSDAASSLRDLGRQLLAVKAENVAGQERTPGVMLAEVPFKLSDTAGDGRMQMFYRKSGAKGEGWSARVILDLNTTGMGPVLGDMRFFGNDMTLTVFVEQQPAADFLSAAAAELADGLLEKGFRLKSRFLVLPPPPAPPSIKAERPAIAGETDPPSASAAERGAPRRGRLDTKA